MLIYIYCTRKTIFFHMFWVKVKKNNRYSELCWPRMSGYIMSTFVNNVHLCLNSAWIIPSQHLEYDHINQTVARIPQVDLGSWSNHDFGCFIQLLKGLKIGVRDKVINDLAFWWFFSSELKSRAAIIRTAEECVLMVSI